MICQNQRQNNGYKRKARGRMNDRFKFRLWHKPLKTMHYNDFIVTATGYMAKIYQQDDYMMKFNQEDLEFDKQCILMQCTGLKDKNGKLIYEGDIVKYKDEVYDLCIGRIQWDNAHYELQYYTGEKYGWFSHILCLKHIKNVEVIGNIYENKELLEEECQK